VSSPAGDLLAVVARPDAPAVPAITLMGPAAIGTCDTATIEVSSPLLVANSIVSPGSFSGCFCPDVKIAEMLLCENFINAGGAGLRVKPISVRCIAISGCIYLANDC